MPGALMQLVAYGAQDVYLTGNPQTTFFKTVYRRHTNFSMECIKQSFKGTVGTGQRVVATIARSGDLVHDCFIKLQADISQAGHNPGHNMIDYTEVEIGGQSIDKHFGHWMEAHAELTEKPGRVNGYQLKFNHFGETTETFREEIDSGADVYQSISPSMFQLTAAAGGVELTSQSSSLNLMVPLRFWFNRHIGLSLPLIALQYHEVNIIIKFSSDDGQSLIDAADKKPTLWCNYIYLDTDERRRFAQVSHEYLIEQVQTQSFTGTGTHTIKLNFNHPVKELVWGALENVVWGELAALGGKFASFHEDLNSTTQLKLNGHDRFEKLEPEYFSRYQIYKYHTGIPCTDKRDVLYVYSFALKPEEHQPSGTCNFSRIDNAQLLFSNLKSGVGNRYIYAVNYNVLRIMSGMGGLAYSN